MPRAKDITHFTQREVFESLRNDYSATKRSKFRRQRTGLPAMGSGADWHLRSDADYLRALEYARDMDRNDVLIGTLLDRAATATIRDGINPDPDTGDEEIDAILMERWQKWCDTPEECDIQGEMTFDVMQYHVFRQVLGDGDIFANLTELGCIQFFEAHRVRRPSNTKRNVVNGVLLDDLRRRLEYWVTVDDIDPLSPLKNVNQTVPYPVRDEHGNRLVAHIFNPKRMSQTRGISALWPIIDQAGMFEDVNFATLVKAQAAACWTILRERLNGSDPLGPPPAGERTNQTLSDGTTRVVEGVAPGMQVTGAPGEKLSGFSPNIPNPEYFPHVRQIITLISINLGVPLCVGLLDASETNYSGFRGALDQARDGFRRNQRMMVTKFNRQVYLWKVRQFIAQDNESGGPLADADQRKDISIFKHTWNYPAWPYIDPYKDTMADDLQVSRGHMAPSELQASRGRDWDRVSRKSVDDNFKAIDYALTRAKELNDKHSPERAIFWRDLLNLPTGDQMNSRFPPPEPDQKPKPQGGNNAA